MRKLISVALLTALLPAFSYAQTYSKTPPVMKLSDPLPANLFVELSRVINPTVVNISTSVLPSKVQPGMRDPMLDMLEQLYGFTPQLQPRSNKPQQVGLGTGFIIRDDGLILTNNHVIQGADIIQVQLSGEEDKLYDAKVVGSDGRTDVALIKIKPDKKLPVAALGNSKDLKVGEWVAAFGNPFGHSHTMTKGIVSSIKREIAEINRVPLIQTDASINPGNSGGPLVNTQGYVVGVNSAIDPRGPGIGFAIPIDDIKKILPDLETRGSIRKGFLGVGLGDHTDESAAEFGLGDKYHGAVIVQVVPHGPADRAGLKMYDTITEVNGKKIRDSFDLTDTISGETPGTTVNLKVITADGQRKTLKAKISERPQEPRNMYLAQQKNSDMRGHKAPFNIGFSVSDLNSQLRQELRIDAAVKKPVITGIERSSLASMAGLQVGDIILEVNKRPINKASDVLKSLKKDSNSFRIARGRQIIVLTFSR